MQRREFMHTAGLSTAAVATGMAAAAAGAQPMTQASTPSAGRFGMHFAPHFGLFREHAGGDLVSELEYAADQGFTAWEDNGMQGRSVEDQTKIARAMERLGMTMGVLVQNPGTAWKPSFSRGHQGDREQFLEETRNAVEVAKRVNATWMTVVCGTREPRMDLGYQTANCIDQLRMACDILEPHGLVMVLEPLNPMNHPNMLLAKMAHAFQICRGVDSPSCKILCDLYHQQITEGNLIPNIDRSWSEIAYFQQGDNPGRKEPWTGEINYLNVFRHIRDKGFTGVLGMEHGKSQGGREGEIKLVEAYRRADPTQN